MRLCLPNHGGYCTVIHLKPFIHLLARIMFHSTVNRTDAAFEAILIALYSNV
jgi:hypothetical protein